MAATIVSDPVQQGRQRPRVRGSLLGVFLVVMAVYGLSPMTQNFDSYLAYPTAWEMVHHRTLYLDDLHQPNVTGHYSNIAVNGGHHVDIFPWADSLLLVPSVLIAD